MLYDLKLEIFLSCMKTYYILLGKFLTNCIHLHLNKIVQLTLLCCQRHGSLTTLVMMFRVTPAFIHIVMTKEEAVSLYFFRNCYTSTHIAKFSVCHAYYEISVVKVSFSNNCTIIIIGIYRPPDKSKIPEFTIKLNEIFVINFTI